MQIDPPEFGNVENFRPQHCSVGDNRATIGCDVTKSSHEVRIRGLLGFENFNPLFGRTTSDWGFFEGSPPTGARIGAREDGSNLMFAGDECVECGKCYFGRTGKD